MCTGASNLRVPALAAAILLIASGTSDAQSLKLASLTLPASVQAGSWVSYEVRIESRNRYPRRFAQRLAVVAREGAGSESGAWVELKTVEPGRTRFERGFFAPSPGHAPAGGQVRLTLARYQRFTPDGKLYEYPVGEEGAPLADEDVSAMDLIEFAKGEVADTLAADTLHMGARTFPCVVVRSQRSGSQDWAAEDTSYVNRAVMKKTSWQSPMVFVTGYARSVTEVFSERVPRVPQAPSTNPSPTDSTGALTILPGSEAAPKLPAAEEDPRTAGRFFYRAEVTMLDQGLDAVPEVTQAPEPAPDEALPRQRILIR